MLNRRFYIAIGWSFVSVACFSVSGCSVDTGDEGRSSTSEDGLAAGRKGVDYSFDRPSPQGLKNAGYTFAFRYLSYSTGGAGGKVLTASEAQALTAAGLDIVANWEWGADDALDGFNGGVEDAKEAQRQAIAAGMPSGRPIYFSVDFDASPGQQATINSYFDGVASVIPRDRIGAYGGYYVIKRLFDAGKIKWGWQTFAWSGGNWDSRAHVRQTQVDVVIAGGACDINVAQTDDFGQWHTGGAGSDCSVHSDNKLYCNNTVGAAMRSTTKNAGSIVNHLRTSPSWFTCWGTGDQHAGGNTTWYYTQGDDNPNYGWVAAVDLSTTSAFDANPTAHGLSKCP